MRVTAPGVAALAVALSLVSACTPSSTPAYPTPDIQAGAGDPFPLRAGDLALVSAQGDFLYVSVQSIGLDTRCPPGAECAEPGYLLVSLELEDSTRQGAAQLAVPPSGQAVITFGAFEIQSLRVEPPGSASRILPTDYILVLRVTTR